MSVCVCTVPAGLAIGTNLTLELQCECVCVYSTCRPGRRDPRSRTTVCVYSVCVCVWVCVCTVPAGLAGGILAVEPQCVCVCVCVCVQVILAVEPQCVCVWVCVCTVPAGLAGGILAVEPQCRHREQRTQRLHREVIPLEGRERLGPLQPTAKSHILLRTHAPEPTQGAPGPLHTPGDTQGTHVWSGTQDKHAIHTDSITDSGQTQQ